MSFEYDTTIIANCQPRMIQDVEVCDWVLTYKLQYPERSQKPLDKQTYQYTIGVHDQEPVYFSSTFWTSDVIQVNNNIVTPDHYFLIRRLEQKHYCWIQAQELDPKRDELFCVGKQRQKPIETLKRLNRKTQVTKLITRNIQPYIAGKDSYLSL